MPRKHGGSFDLGDVLGGLMVGRASLPPGNFLSSGIISLLVILFLEMHSGPLKILAASSTKFDVLLDKLGEIMSKGFVIIDPTSEGM